MPSRNSDELPAVVSVSQMAKRVGLSRSRFYDLVKVGIFPSPVYCLCTRRPMFLTEQQAECLRVRSTNIGVNGQSSSSTRPVSRTNRRAVPDGLPLPCRVRQTAPTRLSPAFGRWGWRA